MLSTKSAKSTIAISLISVLVLSGIALPAAAAGGGSSGTATSLLYSPAPPTYAGSAGKFLSGPTLVPSAFGDPPGATPSGMPHLLAPDLNPRPLVPKGNSPGVGANAGTVPPAVNCSPAGPGCDSVTTSSAATTNPVALNAVDSGTTFGYDIEPSDMGLCAGNGYAMQTVNIGVVQVFDGSTLTPVSGVVSLDSLMGLSALGWGSGGDVSCLYDSANGGHWIITEFVSTTPEPFSPFTGCFDGVYDTCREGIAVSATNDPMGAYNVYFLDPNHVNNDPGSGYLLNDFAKIGTTADAFLLFYDEFNLNPSTMPACPAFGCNGFNGAQEFAFNKAALESGLSVTAPTFNVAYENMGNSPNLYPIPAHPPYQPLSTSCFTGRYAGYVCWYAVIPAQTPDPSQYDNSNGGTGYMVGALDFFGAGDNRLGVFAWTGLSGLTSADCSSCGSLKFGGQLLTTGLTYMNEGGLCPASQGGFCGLAPQKSGPIPLGDNCQAFGVFGTNTTDNGPCPESGLATNGDFLTQASYSDHQLWTAVSTLVNQQFGNSNEIHVGAGYWVVGTSKFDAMGTFTITSQGYVTASHEDLSYPSIAADLSGSALITFTLSGNGGPTGADGGGFYPSTAYGTFTSTSGGLGDHTIHVSALGQSPQDGFTQYIGQNRWGDYTQAIFVPTMGYYFATGSIQHPNCADSAFLSDPTCGGTRDPFANWGSSVNLLPT
jgi:hypothetical protein